MTMAMRVCSILKDQYHHQEEFQRLVQAGGQNRYESFLRSSFFGYRSSTVVATTPRREGTALAVATVVVERKGNDMSLLYTASLYHFSSPTKLEVQR